ncbi:NAD-dependent dehydratase [Clostridium gelidum]|uniref:NAD-dependent dehydratase n=1 Tax=Clostridium gelidum TaxID=704125 RepID=A0ABM7TA50_9CLOT|nr:NAD-dependent epimerase/dehydratase family protein [Clostridium gelidum]BCZ48622.1 NAD-dependent dehydratase [Clostridium gelidum]
MKQILITGSNGFIGSKLKSRLIELNYDIIEFNSSDGDISDFNSIKNINFENIYHIFHLAAKIFVPNSWINPQEYYKVNSFGTVNILEFCKRYNKSLTFISSYIYGQPERLPISEEDKLNPNNPYAHSKFMAEQFCEFYAKQFNVDIAVIRPFNVYGEGQNKKFLIPLIIDQALNDDEIKIKDLSPKRDYIFLDDLIEALILTINKKGYSIYNIGSGNSISVKQIIDVVQEVLSINKPIISEDIKRKNEIFDVIANIGKANNELNWFPKHSFIDGIRKIIEQDKK